MKGSHRSEAVVLLGLTLTMTACSRAELEAITRPPPPGDGGGDSGTPVTCPSPVLQPDRMQTVQVGGVTRNYVLHVPAAYDGSKAVPLVVEFHALNGSGGQERFGSPFPDEVDPDGALMAFPTGLAGPAGAAWNIGPCCVANVDDVAFAREIVAQVSAMACIDPKRVYAVGIVLGAGMAYHVACHAADVFAAVTSTGFDLLQENAGDCQPTRPITVISFRGTEDSLVPYDGGSSALVPGMPITFLGAQATFQRWAEIDGCTGAPSPSDANGCSTYSNCLGGVAVVLCTKAGNAQGMGNASVAWPLLKMHPLP